MKSYRLVLASASPRRSALLASAGLPHIVRPTSAEEPPFVGGDVAGYVAANARLKGRAALAAAGEPEPPEILLAADTVVVIDGSALGKPADADEAVAMLQRLRDRSHAVMTAVWIQRSDGGSPVEELATTRVTFRDFDDRFLRRYVDSGEPLDKAGAYGIQERGVLLARGIEGSWSNVVGLPLERLPDWLDELGVGLDQLLPG